MLLVCPVRAYTPVCAHFAPTRLHDLRPQSQILVKDYTAVSACDLYAEGVKAKESRSDQL